MEAIIHIGMPKVGSTSIQDWLDMHKDRLKDEGVCYFRTAHNRSPNRELAWIGLIDAGVDIDVDTKEMRRALNPETPDGVRSEVAKFKAGLAERVNAGETQTFVGSCEHLFHFERDQIAALDSYLKGVFTSVTYVAYLRHQEDLITSNYSQAIRAGYTGKLDEYVQTATDIILFGKFLDRWADVCGKDNLNVRLLDPDFLTNGDLLDDFAGLLGVATGDPVPRKNEGFSPEHAEFARLLNFKFKKVREGKHKEWEVVRRSMRRLSQTSGKNPRIRLTRDLADHVETITKDHNEAVLKTYFPDRTVLFTPKKTTKYSKDLVTLTVEQAADISADLIIFTDKALTKWARPRKK